MAERDGASHATNAGRTHGKTRRRTGLPCMHESKIQAYLAARDALRRIQRLAALHGPGAGAADPAPGPQPGRARHPAADGSAAAMGDGA